MTIKNKKTRLQFLLNPSFQLNIICKFMILAVLANIIFLVIFLWYFKDIANFAANQGIPSSHIFFDFLNQLKGDFIFYYMIGLIINITIFILGGIIISHKISGPLHKLTTLLKSANNLNDLKDIKFRSKDYFQEIPEEITQLITRQGE